MDITHYVMSFNHVHTLRYRVYSEYAEKY